MRKYELNTVPVGADRMESARVLVGQTAWDITDWEKSNNLYTIKNKDLAATWVHSFLGKALEYSCNVVVLPELSVPEHLVPMITAWSGQTNSTVIAGSHYTHTSDGYVARCPVIISGEIYYIEKIHPAPAEVSTQKGEGLIPGTAITKFADAAVGKFGVLICSDYLKEDVKNTIDLPDLDMLFIISFQKDSSKYYKRIDINVDDHPDGIYIFYANNFMRDHADGRSAVFGVVDTIYKDELQNQIGDGSDLPSAIVSTRSKEDYFIVDVDLLHKRSQLPRTVDTRPNVILVKRGSCFANVPASILTKSHVPADYLGKQVTSTETRIQAFCRKLIARHGLNDDEWAKALSSIYFLVSLAHDLCLTDTDEYKSLIDNFLAHFRLRHNDTIDLLEDKVLVTPEENDLILAAMVEEDEKSTYFAAIAKTRAKNVNMTLMHKNYLYGVVLGISSKHTARVMRTVRDSTIHHLIYKRNPPAFDSAGGWQPYRVSWITARILVSFGRADLSDRQDLTGIDDAITSGLQSLVTRLDSKELWRSGVGEWVSNWECTALCLEAFLAADKHRNYCSIIDAVVRHVLERKEDWLREPPDFTDEFAANETLASALLSSVILQISKSYSQSTSLVTAETRRWLLQHLYSCLEAVDEQTTLNPRQFCTVPQLMAYCMLATKG